MKVKILKNRNCIIRIKTTIVVFCAIVLLAAISVSVFASEYTMRLTTPLGESGSVGQGLIRFAELVEERSDGRIRATTNFAGELGTQREMVEMVIDGSLEVVTALASDPARWVPPLSLFEFPYIYKDEAHLVRVLNELEEEVSRLLEPHNMFAVGGQNMGFRFMLNRVRPIYALKDLKGLKMRGPNPVYVGMFEAMGASGTTTDWGEIYGALQTGVIDGMEASPDMLYSMRFHEVAQYMSKTYHIAACVYYLIGKNWFEGLPSDLQDVVMESARDAAEFQNALDMNAHEVSLQKMINEGLKVNEVDDIGEFMRAVEDWKDEYVAKRGSDWIDLYEKIMAVE